MPITRIKRINWTYDKLVSRVDASAGATRRSAGPRRTPAEPIEGHNMKANIGIAEKQRDGVGRILNALLADEFVLYVKARRFHWNVVGSDFGELHEFFESQYEALDEIVDEVAERARALDIIAAGSLQEFLELTRLKESAGKNPDARGMLAALLADHEGVIRNLRQDLETAGKLGDAGTNDFLTGLMEQHEKFAWMLRSYLR
jgi:starvation-inducible DNA-binding protein